MARRYARILGTLAATAVLLRGSFAGSGVNGTLLMAIGSLVCFAAIGWVVGLIAQQTADEAVRIQLEAQLVSHAKGHD